jgi:hypothetical protein
VLKPAMLSGCHDVGVIGHEPLRRTLRPPDRLDDGRPKPPRRSGNRRFVESDELVTDLDVTDRSPGHIRVEDGRFGAQTIDTTVLAAAVGIQAPSKADIRALILREDGSAPIAKIHGADLVGRRAVVVVLELNVQLVVAVRRRRIRAASLQHDPLLRSDTRRKLGESGEPVKTRNRESRSIHRYCADAENVADVDVFAVA